MEYELISERLYLKSLINSASSCKGEIYIESTGKYLYKSFDKDFGPLDVQCIFNFCKDLNAIIINPEYALSKIFVFTTVNEKDRSNAAVLVGVYMAIYLNFTMAYISSKLNNIHPHLVPFCDFTGDEMFKISVVDVIEAFVFGVRDKLMDFKTFNPDQFLYYAESKHGNMSIVVPQKIIAFMSPYDSKVDPDGKPAFQAFDYHRVFTKMNVKLVIRLNEIESYDSNVFEKIGIAHINLPVDHGTCPPLSAINTFINAVNNCSGVVAVHCRSGLGRAGTLIAFYLMHRFGWTSRHAIAWVRMCRPGSIIASQQTYLARMRNKVMIGKTAFVNPLSQEDCTDDAGVSEKFDEHYKEKWEQDKVRQAEMRINELKLEMEKAVAVINMYSSNMHTKSLSFTNNSDDGRPIHNRNLSIDSTLPSVCTPRKSQLGLKRSDFFDFATPKVRFEEPLTPTRKSGSITPLETPRSPLKSYRGSFELDSLNLKGVDGVNPLLPSTPRSILKITSPLQKPLRKPGSFFESDFSLSVNNNEVFSFSKHNNDKMNVFSPPKTTQY